MAWFKRIFLFMLVNFLVVMTISLLLHVLGVRPYLTHYGLDYRSLAVFCLVWGMGGAFISLLLSKQMAKWMMGVQMIEAHTSNRDERLLLQMVHALSQKAGLPKMPEVGIYESPEINAFATGPTRSNALVAVSRGLLNRMNESEVEGVVGHEVSHIANGDMVTMTLIQGVVNAFVMFLARVLAFAIANAGRDREDRRGGGSYFLIQFALEMVFMILGSMVVAWFSRYREFRADAGSAQIAGREKMILALQALQRAYELPIPENNAPAFQAMKISSRTGSFLKLFASHPPLEERIERLRSTL